MRTFIRLLLLTAVFPIYSLAYVIAHIFKMEEAEEMETISEWFMIAFE